MNSGTAVIPCKPVGSPKPKVTWYKGSTLLGAGDKFRVSNDGTLSISKAAKSDRGTYTCVGKNSFGEIKKETYLMIKGITHISIVEFSRSYACILKAHSHSHSMIGDSF